MNNDLRFTKLKPETNTMTKILAIDHQKDNLKTIKAVINYNMPDCEVLTALSGKEGLEIARNEQPDAILLDIIMPQMDGYEVCKRLKEDESTNHIPVVMITTIKTDAESRIKGLNTGADAFLPKPIDPVELTAQVNVMLRIKSAEDKLRAEKGDLDQKVTERTKELRESEEKYRSIFEGAHDGILHIDKAVRVLNVNPAFTEITGLSIETVVGKSGFDLSKKFVESKHFPRILNIIKSVILKKQVGPYEINYQDKILEISVRKQESGQSVGIIRDITKRKKTEDLLVKSEKKYRDLFEKSKDAILIIKNEKFVDCNQATIQMLRYNNKEEFLNKYPSELSPEKQPDGKMSFAKADEMFEIAYKNGSHRFEWNHKKSDGEVFPVEVLLTAISSDEKNQILYTVWRDITNRKKAEEELHKHREHLEELVKERTQKLEEQNKELERFNNLFVNREFRIKELRDRVKELEEKISE
ncbi:MAG: PAS domain S-box protein [Bacteroidales bacterium]|nr:PAS domain S-box protein [Bacteroidales bacterium]